MKLYEIIEQRLLEKRELQPPEPPSGSGPVRGGVQAACAPHFSDKVNLKFSLIKT